MLAIMKKFGKEAQISFRSLPGIVGGLDFAAARLAVTERFHGDKLRTGHLVNAVALWLARMNDEELSLVAPPLLRKLEQYLEYSEDDSTVLPERNSLQTGNPGPLGPPRVGTILPQRKRPKGSN